MLNESRILFRVEFMQLLRELSPLILKKYVRDPQEIRYLVQAEKLDSIQSATVCCLSFIIVVLCNHHSVNMEFVQLPN